MCQNNDNSTFKKLYDYQLSNNLERIFHEVVMVHCYQQSSKPVIFLISIYMDGLNFEARITGFSTLNIEVSGSNYKMQMIVILVCSRSLKTSVCHSIKSKNIQLLE